MPFDYSRFLRTIEFRARTLRGLSVASSAVAATSLVTLAVMIAIRLLRIPIPYWSLAAFVLPSLVAGAVGYAFGRSGRPRIPHLLLQIDDTLGLNARFSSLYELRRRGGGSIFRERIEAEVRDAAPEWRTALPVGRRTILGGSAGACCIALAVGLAFVPLPTITGSPSDMLSQSSAFSQDPLSENTGSLTTPVTQAAAPLTLKTDTEADREAGQPTLAGPGRDQTLEDVMRDLSWMSPDEAVLVPISPDEIEELARLQGEAMRAINQLLEAIRDRLEDASPSDPSELTEEELEALQRQVDRGGLPPEIQEGLNELMNRRQPRSAEEIVEQLIEQLGDEGQSERESSEDSESRRPQSTAVAPSAQDIEDLLDELGQASSDEEDGSKVAPPPASGESSGLSQDADGEASSSGQLDRAGREGEEEPGQSGGTSGSSALSDGEREREPGFIREEERAKIGTIGEFISEFVTEGVPIELMPGPNGDEASFRVSYEQIASILRERGVPEGAIEIVRNYFNAIAEGGP
jgi:hypothetical protein